MSRRTQENIMAGAILCVFIGVIVMSLDYGPRARMIPLPLATFGVILIVIQLVWQNLRSTDELQMDMLQTLVTWCIRTEDSLPRAKYLPKVAPHGWYSQPFTP